MADEKLINQILPPVQEQVRPLQDDKLQLPPSHWNKLFFIRYIFEALLKRRIENGKSYRTIFCALGHVTIAEWTRNQFELVFSQEKF